MNISAITHPESYADVKSFRFSGNCVSAPELEEKLKKFPSNDEPEYDLELELTAETGKTEGSYHICLRKEGSGTCGNRSGRRQSDRENLRICL